jgi:hypothetical protein
VRTGSFSIADHSLPNVSANRHSTKPGKSSLTHLIIWARTYAVTVYPTMAASIGSLLPSRDCFWPVSDLQRCPLSRRCRGHSRHQTLWSLASRFMSYLLGARSLMALVVDHMLSRPIYLGSSRRTSLHSVPSGLSGVNSGPRSNSRLVAGLGPSRAIFTIGPTTGPLSGLSIGRDRAQAVSSCARMRCTVFTSCSICLKPASHASRPGRKPRRFGAIRASSSGGTSSCPLCSHAS